MAVSVVRGEVFPHIGDYTHDSGAITNIPLGIENSIRPGPCLGIAAPPSCSTKSAPQGSVTVVTSEGRNFPLFYFLVGWPSLFVHGLGAWYAMRIVGAFWCALLLASGATVLLSMKRRPVVMGAAMLVGLTPLALGMTGSVNPSGLEAASALCFWAVTLALIHDCVTISRRLVIGLAVVSGVLLATCRNIGWLWVLLAVLLSLLTASAEELRAFGEGT